MARRLVCLGYGYVASALAQLLRGEGWSVTGTQRQAPADAAMIAFDGKIGPPSLFAAITEADAILASSPPDDDGDPAWRLLQAACGASGAWLGYLSTTGVYGDRAGGWVFEDDRRAPSSAVSARRVIAEDQWRSIGAQVFRLPGIYGPGRSAFDRLRRGEARRVIKPGLVHSRAHVDDIAAVLAASLARPSAGRIYNVADDTPAPPQDVVAYAAQLLNMAPPPERPYAPEAVTPAAQRFYLESRRVSNARAKAELGWRPQYPSYREGLAAVLAEERGAAA
jgi:nucleoside-diphosphate-sugar epimerase